MSNVRLFILGMATFGPAIKRAVSRIWTYAFVLLAACLSPLWWSETASYFGGDFPLRYPAPTWLSLSAAIAYNLTILGILAMALRAACMAVIARGAAHAKAYRE